MRKMKVTLDIVSFVESVRILTGKRYISIKDVSRILGVDERTAGRILSKAVSIGIAKRISRRAVLFVDDPWSAFCCADDSSIDE
ncbi:MAG: hypothetical protein GSR81_03580 [Desulfurococcales archaeon]|nr:hypothetical protein [Desulfurococcales archaeon]